MSRTLHCYFRSEHNAAQFPARPRRLPPHSEDRRVRADAPLRRKAVLGAFEAIRQRRAHGQRPRDRSSDSHALQSRIIRRAVRSGSVCLSRFRQSSRPPRQRGRHGDGQQLNPGRTGRAVQDLQGLIVKFKRRSWFERRKLSANKLFVDNWKLSAEEMIKRAAAPCFSPDYSFHCYAFFVVARSDGAFVHFCVTKICEKQASKRCISLFK